MMDDAAGSAGTTGMGTGTEGPQGLATISAGALGLLNQAGVDLGLGKPFSEPIRLIDRVRVAGTSKVAGADEAALELLPGDRLTLRREPLNAYDRRAILVLAPCGGNGSAGEQKLGYLPVDVNDIPSRLMDAGKDLYARMLSTARRGRYTFIEIEVYLDD